MSAKKKPLIVTPMWESDDCYAGSFTGFESKGHQDKEAFASAVIDAVHEWDGTWVDIDLKDVHWSQGYRVPSLREPGCWVFYPTSGIKRGVYSFTFVWVTDMLPLWPPLPESPLREEYGEMFWDPPDGQYVPSAKTGVELK